MELYQLVSDGYKRVLQETHDKSGGKWGTAGKGHVEEVRLWAVKLGAKSVLDYGCGKGTLFDDGRLRKQFECTEFDPGIAGKDAMPVAADVVVCTDVLEHVEPDFLDNVLKHIRSLTTIGAYFIIAQTPAKLTLTDGRNAHLILRPTQWWLDRLNEHGLKVHTWTVRKGLNVWVKVN